MSSKKIIFFIISWILLILVIIGAIILSSSNNKKSGNGTILVWVNEWTNEDFTKIVESFKQTHPELKKSQILIEKQTSDPKKYRTLLLKTLADGNGPDIFMVPRGEDELLESYVQPISEKDINIADFERRFDMRIFDNLIIEDTSNKNQQLLMWIPLGYETLWLFYNSNLLKNGVPRNEKQIEHLYNQSSTFFPTNLWLSSIYTPNALDLITLFLSLNNINSYRDIGGIIQPFASYYSFGDLSIVTTNEDNIYNQDNTLRQQEEWMANARLTTIDKFVRGEIALIIWYPSIITELEKAHKRASKAHSEDAKIFRTDRLPQFSLKTKNNIAKFNYFGISKNTSNYDLSVKFLNFLGSPDAQTIALDIFPYLLPAQREFYPTIEHQPQALSSIFSRTRIDAFLPKDEQIIIFDYWVKSTFDLSLKENWHLLKNRKDASMLGNIIFKDISCEMAPYIKNSNLKCE